MHIALRVFFTVALLAWVLGFIFYKIKKGERRNDRLVRGYMETERAANQARKHEIDPALFFTADLSVLPTDEGGGDSKEKYETVLLHAKKTMIRFKDPVSNVELKMAYGPMQLESIAAYEENFNEYLRALVKWAESLYEQGITADALRILEYTLELGSDFRDSYRVAADIYKARGDYEKLNGLLERAEAFPFKDEGIKRNIVKYIMDLKDN